MCRRQWPVGMRLWQCAISLTFCQGPAELLRLQWLLFVSWNRFEPVLKQPVTLYKYVKTISREAPHASVTETSRQPLQRAPPAVLRLSS